MHKPELAGADLVALAVESPAGAGGASLATARVVVGGGRGVGGPDGFAPLEELAGLLGGVVGVSRVVTSEGWRPHAQQVGQTGTWQAARISACSRWCAVLEAVQPPRWPWTSCRVLTHIVEYVYCQLRGMLCARVAGHPIRTHYPADQKRSDDD